VSVAFLFPGQDSQRPGMLHGLPDHPAIRATLEEASAALGREVRDLDTDASLASTVGVQVALLVAGVAVARALEAEGATPDFVAGLSVGAFAAAVTAGCLDFRAALPLVRLRAELMESAYPHGYGLAAVVGLDERQVAALVQQVSTAQAPVYLANVNAPRQIVIAGADPGLERVLDRARALGVQKAKRLRVSVPSHCPLLQAVADQLTSALAPVRLLPPRVPYAGNRNGRALRDPELIREDLAGNVAHPVRWHDATTVLFERGAQLFVEMPPGRVLTDLASSAFPEARAVAVADVGLAWAVSLIRRHRAP
jgi:malonate decarboxylase epsilon subunit